MHFFENTWAYVIYRGQIGTETQSKKIFFEILMFRYLEGELQILGFVHTRIFYNFRTTAHRKKILVSNDAEDSVFYLSVICKL